MNLLDVIITSERLIMRPTQFEDAEVIFREFTAEITRYMFPRPAEKIEGTRAFVDTSIQGLQVGTNLQLTVLRKEDREFLGCTGLHQIGTVEPELGIWIKKSAHGNGYGLEAVSALIEWARQNVEFDHFKYPVDKKNFASRRIPERNGGKVMKEYKKMNQSNQELDEVEYWIE